MKRAIVLILSLSLIGLSCATKTTVRQHPDFNARREAIRNILVVPPLVEINRRVAGGNVERLKEEAERVATDLTELVIKEFSTRGFKTVTEQDGRFQDSNLAQTSQYAFQELSKTMWNRFPDVEAEAKNYRYTLSGASKLAASTSTDTVVFVKFNGFTRSGGDIASEVASKTLVAALTAGLFVQFKDPSGVAVLDIALVDGRNGDVLWGNRMGKLFYGLTGPDFLREELSELVSKVVIPFHQ